MSSNRNSVPVREVGREGKAAFAAYLAFRRVSDTLTRISLDSVSSAAGSTIGERDILDANEGRLSKAGRGILRGLELFPQAAESLTSEDIASARRFSSPDFSLARKQTEVLLRETQIMSTHLTALLGRMRDDELATQPTSIRYLPDVLRDFSMLRRATALLGRALPDIHVGYPSVVIGVFGSVARGEGGPDSDLDLLYEVTEGTLPLRDEATLLAMLREALAPLGVSIDIVLASELLEDYLAVVLNELVRMEETASDN